MFARKVAEAQAKSADNATGTPQRSTAEKRPDASAEDGSKQDFLPSTSLK